MGSLRPTGGELAFVPNDVATTSGAMDPSGRSGGTFGALGESTREQGGAIRLLTDMVVAAQLKVGELDCEVLRVRE